MVCVGSHSADAPLFTAGKDRASGKASTLRLVHSDLIEVSISHVVIASALSVDRAELELVLATVGRGSVRSQLLLDLDRVGGGR